MAGAFGQAWDILKREDYRQAGGTLIRDSEGRVLLVRRNELLPDGTLKPGGSFHGMYELPGGNVDPGETPQEGVARETLEETGLPLVNMTALEPNVYDDKRKVYHGFTADIDPSHEGDVQLSDEHEKYLWMHPHEALAMNEHPDGMDMPRWLSQDAITFFRGMVGGDDMQGEPMAKAWEFLKALPEQQQYTDLPALNEGFEEETPQHRVGTVNPAIIGMLERYRNATQFDARGNPVGLPPKNMRAPAVLRTTGTSPSNPPLPRMIEAHPGRMGRPGLDYELYGDSYGQSPQFLSSLPAYDGNTDNEGIVAKPYTETQTVAPPKGSPQAMIDELYERSPSSAARAFNTKR